MANYYSEIKGRMRKERVGNVKSATVSAKQVVAKAAMSKNVSSKSISKLGFVDGAATRRLVNSMDLDEMLEASKVIEMGIKGEKIPTVKSSKAQKYARTTLRLNGSAVTRPRAEKMMHDLNVQIIKENKKTTDAVESRRLYKELMTEE